MGIKKFEAFGIDEVMQLWLECVDKNYCPKGIGRQLIIYLKERYKQLSLTVYQKIN